jgi:hypothetical protein
MASYLKPGEAKNYARWLAELREKQTLDGRAVENWSQKTSEDGLQLFLQVTFAPLNPAQRAPAGVPSNWGISETYSFPALAVAALEKTENTR